MQMGIIHRQAKAKTLLSHRSEIGEAPKRGGGKCQKRQKRRRELKTPEKRKRVKNAKARKRVENAEQEKESEYSALNEKGLES